MADDLLVTPGSGATIRAIEIGGKLIQAVADVAFDDDGWTVYSLLAAGSTQDASITATETILHAIVAVNINASVRYLKLYDKASAPTSSDTPALRLPLTGGATGIPIVIPNLNADFTLGLGLRITTGIADNDTGAPTASQTLVNLLYKAQ